MRTVLIAYWNNEYKYMRSYIRTLKEDSMDLFNVYTGHQKNGESVIAITDITMFLNADLTESYTGS